MRDPQSFGVLVGAVAFRMSKEEAHFAADMRAHGFSEVTVRGHRLWVRPEDVKYLPVIEGLP